MFTDIVDCTHPAGTTTKNNGLQWRTRRPTYIACRTPSPAAAAAGGGARCWRHHPASLPARCHGRPRRLNEGEEEQKEEDDRPRRHEIRMMPSCRCISPIVCNAWFEQIPTRARPEMRSPVRHSQGLPDEALHWLAVVLRRGVA